MSLRIKVSFTEDNEAETVLNLLKPIMGRFRVKKKSTDSEYKILYLMPKQAKK